MQAASLADLVTMAVRLRPAHYRWPSTDTVVR
jgi:hypothetical protein